MQMLSVFSPVKDINQNFSVIIPLQNKMFSEVYWNQYCEKNVATSIYSFSNNVYYHVRNKNHYEQYLTISQTSFCFYLSAVFLLKILWKVENVFYLFGEFFAIFIKFRIVICKLFQFGTV